MRFCPFCAAETQDEATHCSACARKLPPARISSVVQAVAPASPPPATVTPTVTPEDPVGSAGSTTPSFPPPPPTLPPTPSAPPSPPRADPTPTRRVAPAPTPDGARDLTPVPEPPDTGLFGDARYVLALLRARWERRTAVRAVDAAIQKDVAALDQILGELGRAGRAHNLTARPLGEENAAIDAAQTRASDAERATADVQARLTEENARFAATAKELEAKLAAAEESSKAAAAELAKLEDERRTLRERKKQVETKQRQHLRGAEERETRAAKLAIGPERAGVRRSAEELLSDAARLEPERSDLEKKLDTLEQPLTAAQAHADAARADLEATRKAQGDARAGHRHRRAELEAEAARAARTRSDATGEVSRRLVTLGTLLNLNRITAPELDPLYTSVDGLRASIANRERDIERLRAEASRSDPRAVARGTGVLLGSLVVLITVICLVLSLR